MIHSGVIAFQGLRLRYSCRTTREPGDAVYVDENSIELSLIGVDEVDQKLFEAVLDSVASGSRGASSKPDEPGRLATAPRLIEELALRAEQLGRPNPTDGLTPNVKPLADALVAARMRDAELMKRAADILRWMVE